MIWRKHHGNIEEVIFHFSGRISQEPHVTTINSVNAASENFTDKFEAVENVSYYSSHKIILKHATAEDVANYSCQVDGIKSREQYLEVICK